MRRDVRKRFVVVARPLVSRRRTVTALVAVAIGTVAVPVGAAVAPTAAPTFTAGGVIPRSVSRSRARSGWRADRRWRRYRIVVIAM